MGEHDENPEEVPVPESNTETEDTPPDVIDADDAVEAEVVELDPHAALKEELSVAQARLRTVSKAYTDLQKEMKAFRERMELQSKAKGERQAFETVSAILEPVQNLKRSLAMEADSEAFRSGIEMVHHQFMEALGKLGLKEAPGEGAEFDPAHHEALAVQPVDDASKDNKVLQVHRTGYIVNGKLLQAAQVLIGKHEKPAEA